MSKETAFKDIVELLAAERAEKEELTRRNDELEREVTILRDSFFEEKEAHIADNAAKDARIEELEKYLETASHNAEKYANDCVVLEAKLAAATDLLTEAFEELSDLEGLAFDCMDRIASFLAARAVLGGRSSC